MEHSYCFLVECFSQQVTCCSSTSCMCMHMYMPFLSLLMAISFNSAQILKYLDVFRPNLTNFNKALCQGTRYNAQQNWDLML